MAEQAYETIYMNNKPRESQIRPREVLTRLPMIATSSHQNVRADIRLEAKRNITAAVASTSRAAQTPIRARVLSWHIVCMPGSEHMSCIVDIVYIPAVGCFVIAEAIACPFIVELAIVVAMVMAEVAVLEVIDVVGPIVMPAMPAIFIVAIAILPALSLRF